MKRRFGRPRKITENQGQEKLSTIGLCTAVNTLCILFCVTQEGGLFHLLVHLGNLTLVKTS